MHSAVITVECDHEAEDYCEAEFTVETSDGEPLGDVGLLVLHQARLRGWATSFDDRGRTLYVCPLHRKADDAR